MARSYAKEMARFPETLEWANCADITPIRSAIRRASPFPLRAIGSGGSLTTAHTLAYFHQHHARQIAAIATPLEAIECPLDHTVSHWLLTAGGGNVDILAATRALIYREPRQLVVMCGRDGSPITQLCQRHPFTDLLLFPPPTGKDGFLATNSLLGFTALLARAYMVECNGTEEWGKTYDIIQAAAAPGSETLNSWQQQSAPLWSRPTTLILYGPSTRIGAIDLESKFTEAALGNLQLADFRNFAHGRHNWLAKRGELSAVLAFITDADKTLAERTLGLIPTNIPIARLRLPENSSAAVLLSIVASLSIAGWAGAARGIDPGRPGVPEFGRKLYRLLPARNRSTAQSNASARDIAAIARKCGVPMDHVTATAGFERWKAALETFRAQLCAVRFAGIVIDYDGTIIEIRNRFRPPGNEIKNELIRLIEAGIWIGVATGRGGSVRQSLQATLPEPLWARVVIGYYNGAVIAGLSDDGVPDRSEVPCDSLRGISAAFCTQPEIVRSANKTVRPFQVTLETTRTVVDCHLWDIVNRIIWENGDTTLRVFRSSHSIDVVAAGVSKTNVLQNLRQTVGDAPLLTIGDRGRWPGNDYELLGEPYSLSVDRISVDPKTCWNLARPGQRGTAVTLDYLSCLENKNERLRFKPQAFK